MKTEILEQLESEAHHPDGVAPVIESMHLKLVLDERKLLQGALARLTLEATHFRENKNGEQFLVAAVNDAIALLIEAGGEAAKESDEGGPIRLAAPARWVCGTCGSDSIECTAWVDPNTEAVSDGEAPDDDVFCHDCDEHVRMVTDSDYAAEKKAAGEVGLPNHDERCAATDAAFPKSPGPIACERCRIDLGDKS